MKEWLSLLTEKTVIVIEAMALLVIAFGTVEAFIKSVGSVFLPITGPQRREVWLRYARWLVAGLTFQLAADIIETSIATSWQALVRLGAIAVIRTFLNYFLDRDLAEARARQQEVAGEA
jgi:uncharacterized membrane protein